MGYREEKFKEINAAIGDASVLAVDVLDVSKSCLHSSLEPFVTISNALFDEYELGEKLSAKNKKSFKDTLNFISELEEKFDNVNDVIFVNVREIYDYLGEKLSAETMCGVDDGSEFSDCLYEIDAALNEACDLTNVVTERAKYLAVCDAAIDDAVERLGCIHSIGFDAVAMLENDGYKIGEYNPHKRSAWLINGSILALGDCESDALNNAVDEGLMDEFMISQEDYAVLLENDGGGSCILLGNADEPFDGDLITSIKRVITG